MKLPLSWLAEWVDIAVAPGQLAAQLTMAGFEVESLGPAAPPFEGVIVAEILDTEPHPQADKLRVCRVATGEGTVQVVCGAGNAWPGLKSALAMVGAVLPGDVLIESATLRGVQSQGMLCSARELGLGEIAGAGIIELPADAPTGVPLRSYLELDEPVIDVSIPPNRGDAMSVLGLAREVAAMLRKSVIDVPPIARVPQVADESGARIEAPQAAPRLLTRILRGVDNRRTSPAWLRRRLQRCGLRSISPVVDVTNYVLLELGQPMHAYDQTSLNGPLRVRLAQEDEPLTLLDGREIRLSSDVAVIADDARAIGLAGIMGGAGTAIGGGARDVLLEVAFFAPAAIAGRARRYGLQTEASQRFERGVDPQGQERALERATELILQICGGKAGPVSRAGSAPVSFNPPSISLRRERLQRVMGYIADDAAIEGALRGYGMQVAREGSSWRVTPPTYRFDLAIEADLVEEVIRGLGYERVPEKDARMPQRVRRLTESKVEERVVLDTLVARGYQEIVTFGFVDPQLQGRLFPRQETLRLANPIASDLAVLRVSLWPGLLHAALENARRQQERIRLCEIANVFPPGAAASDERGAHREPQLVSGIALGTRWPEQWGLERAAVDFFDVKADVLALLALSGEPQAFGFEPATVDCLHPGRAAAVTRGGRPLGLIGELHPALVRELGFTYAPILFEIDLARATAVRLPRHEPVSRQPQVRRDLSFTLPETTPLSAVRERVSVAASSLLRDLRVFDLYQGPGIETGRKSVALGLILQDNSRTLTDDEADRIIGRINADLRANLDARIRE